MGVTHATRRLLILCSHRLSPPVNGGEVALVIARLLLSVNGAGLSLRLQGRRWPPNAGLCDTAARTIVRLVEVVY